MMSREIELRARITMAAACTHFAKDNNADAVSLVNFFLQDVLESGKEMNDALESLTRAGIYVTLLAAQPNQIETLERITQELAFSEL
jgi:hypothetical protein